MGIDARGLRTLSPRFGCRHSRVARAAAESPARVGCPLAVRLFRVDAARYVPPVPPPGAVELGHQRRDGAGLHEPTERAGLHFGRSGASAVTTALPERRHDERLRARRAWPRAASPRERLPLHPQHGAQRDGAAREAVVWRATRRAGARAHVAKVPTARRVRALVGGGQQAARCPVEARGPRASAVEAPSNACGSVRGALCARQVFDPGGGGCATERLLGGHLERLGVRVVRAPLPVLLGARAGAQKADLDLAAARGAGAHGCAARLTRTRQCAASTDRATPTRRVLAVQTIPTCEMPAGGASA